MELIAIPALGGKKRSDLGRTVSPDEKHLILTQRHYETQELMLVDNLQCRAGLPIQSTQAK
jgi:hypothetical protein